MNLMWVRYGDSSYSIWAQPPSASPAALGSFQDSNKHFLPWTKKESVNYFFIFLECKNTFGVFCGSIYQGGHLVLLSKVEKGINIK